MINEIEGKKLQYIKEQIRKRIETLKEILDDEADGLTRSALIGRAAVIEDWMGRLTLPRRSRLMLNSLYVDLMGLNTQGAWLCLDEIANVVEAADKLSGRDGLSLFDEDAPAEEIDHYLYDFARERMRRTPSRVFDKETQERYGVREWRNGHFVNQHGEDEPDDMPGMSVIELLELSEL